MKERLLRGYFTERRAIAVRTSLAEEVGLPRPTRVPTARLAQPESPPSCLDELFGGTGMIARLEPLDNRGGQFSKTLEHRGCGRVILDKRE